MEEQHNILYASYVKKTNGVRNKLTEANNFENDDKELRPLFVIKELRIFNFDHHFEFSTLTFKFSSRFPLDKLFEFRR